jgi:hypothetical protein
MIASVGALATCRWIRRWSLRCACSHRIPEAVPGETTHPSGGRGDESPARFLESEHKVL